MTEDERAKVAAWREAYRAERERMAAGARRFAVKFDVMGSITYYVNADSGAEAVTKAWERWDGGEDPDRDDTEPWDDGRAEDQGPATP